MGDRPLWASLKHFVACRNNIHRRSSGPDVFIFSSPRSGSTWLMELILTQPGFKPCNEPFDLRSRWVYEHLSRLGIRRWEDLYRPELEPVIETYVKDLASGSLGLMNPFFYRNHWRIMTSRTVFKILHSGENRINWYQETFAGRIVLLIRHPIPVSLSRKVLPRLEAFLQTEFSESFSPAELSYARELLNRGNDLEKAVLDWCLQNAIPLRTANRDWTVLTYEQLVLDPFPALELLARRLELPKPSRMYRQLNVASGSISESDDKTKQVLDRARQRGIANTWLVEKWRERVEPRQAKRAMNVLAHFDLTRFYQPDSVVSESLWISSDDGR